MIEGSGIVALVAIVLVSILFLMAVLGCILMQCCSASSCCPASSNLFWKDSAAQRHLVRTVGGRRKLRVGSHRGGSINAPENTIAAFQYAVRCGAGLLELDLNISKDGVPIVSHDHELERVIDKDWLRAHPQCKTVSDCLSTDLPPLAQSIPLHFHSPTRSHYTAADYDHPQQGDVNSNPALMRFCTLQEFLDFAPPDVALHIDIKQPSEKLVSETLAIVSRHSRAATPNIVLGAANPTNSTTLYRTLKRSRGCGSCCCDDQNLCGCAVCCTSCCCCSCCSCGVDDSEQSTSSISSSPSQRQQHQQQQKSSQQQQHQRGEEPLLHDKRPLLFANIFHVIITQLFYFLGILPWIPITFDVYSVPAPTSFMSESFKGRGGGGCCASCILAFAFCFLNTPKLWAYLRSRGVVVFVWVLNSPECFAEAAQWPIDGIMTDDTPLLVSFYQANPTVFMSDPPCLRMV